MSSAALLVLTLPHSNADEEHVFSLIKKNKTEFRGSLDLNRTVSSIITVEMNLDGESHQFRPSASLIKKSDSSTGEYNRLHKKTAISSRDTNSHHQPVASPKENAPATPPNRNHTEPPSSMDKTAPVLQSQNATNCKLPTLKVQAKASATNDCKPGSLLQMIIPLQPTRMLIQLNRKADLFGKKKSLGSVFPAKQTKKEEKVVVHKERRQRLMTNKKKKHQFHQKSQTTNYAEFPMEGCLV